VQTSLLPAAGQGILVTIGLIRGTSIRKNTHSYAGRFEVFRLVVNQVKERGAREVAD